MKESQVEDHQVIYLEPAPGAEPEEAGRLWCQDNIWQGSTEYVRADLAEALYDALEEVCQEFAHGHPSIIQGRAALAKSEWKR